MLDYKSQSFRPNPPCGRLRMSVERRAKIFMPFDPLDGFSAALRAVELEPEDFFYENNHTPTSNDDFSS